MYIISYVIISEMYFPKKIFQEINRYVMDVMQYN